MAVTSAIPPENSLKICETFTTDTSNPSFCWWTSARRSASDLKSGVVTITISGVESPCRFWFVTSSTLSIPGKSDIGSKAINRRSESVVALKISVFEFFVDWNSRGCRGLLMSHILRLFVTLPRWNSVMFPVLTERLSQKDSCAPCILSLQRVWILIKSSQQLPLAEAL